MSVFDLFRDDEGLSGFPALVQGLLKDVVALVCVVFLLTPFQTIRDELWHVFHDGAGAFLASFGILLGIATISRYTMGWGRTLFTLAGAVVIFLVGFILHEFGWIMLGYVASWLLIVPALGFILAAQYKTGLVIAIPALTLAAVFGPIRDLSKPTGSFEGLGYVECGKVDGE